MTPDASAQLRVALNTRLEVELVTQSGDCERLFLDVVPDAAADFDNGRLGIGTALAKALLGQRAGAVIPYVAGDLRQVRVLGVRWSQVDADDEAAERRRAALAAAIDAAEKTSAAIFASSFTSKWGGYDLTD
jgi:hypothetical protein